MNRKKSLVGKGKERKGKERKGKEKKKSDKQSLFFFSFSYFFRLLLIKMVAGRFNVDMKKPLFSQVGHLGEAYQEWVHQPIVSKEGPRFFRSDVIEFLTRTIWWVVPVVWLPVICYFTMKSIQMGHTFPQISLILASGIFIWTLLEYTFHRFLFHIQTKTYWGNTIHFLLHGCHHKHPMDDLRLVFPPTAIAILCLPFYSLVRFLSTPTVAPALFGGCLLGYVIYDCTHFYLHHGQPTTSQGRYLKKYHLNHHYRIQNKGFGITSSLWDRVFGTMPT
ncbi:Fatty acid 2-hydroxylase [Zostera marina]|uniref:Fatty acid 2-hydroxylase n=1 Tax=Zostera marina TaxID=29655 RepID=A0A0K9NLW9_ZOSMR|nr:Fatty acid 2-hydroxylase [Zostera marina]